MRRRLALLPVLMALALALTLPGGALAAGSSGESTSGYGSTPSEKPKEGGEPSKGSEPSKGGEPSKGSEPSKESTEPAKEKASPSAGSPSSEKASTLPFTGFDLRWSLVVGGLLMGAGFTIVMVQRRRDGSR